MKMLANREQSWNANLMPSPRISVNIAKSLFANRGAAGEGIQISNSAG